MASTDEGRLPLLEERRLIEAAQCGCAKSARSLVEAHQDRLHAFVWRMLRDEHESQEVTQEAFLRAFAALDSFDFGYRFSTWLFTIAYRLCLNQLRRRRDFVGEVDFGRMSSTGRDGEAETLDASEAVANSDQARELRERIWSAVDELPPAQRATVLLFYREQLSCQHIGRVLDMPAATVKSHLHRARARLRVALADLGQAEWMDVRFNAETGM